GPPALRFGPPPHDASSHRRSLGPPGRVCCAAATSAADGPPHRLHRGSSPRKGRGPGTPPTPRLSPAAQAPPREPTIASESVTKVQRQAKKKAAAPKERPPKQQVGRLLEGLEAQTVRLGAFLAEAALLVLLVLAIVALEELHVRITLERQNVRGDTVQEPAIVADHQRHARELQQRILERTQRLHVEIVGRLVEQQHVAALQQRLGQVQTAALTAGERADQLLLVRALEVETADVGARLDLDTVDVEDVRAAGDLLEHRVVALQRRAALVDIGQLHGGAEDDLAGVRLLLAGDHLEQRRLAGAVGADDADDGAV